jgi:hypothetical protein
MATNGWTITMSFSQRERIVHEGRIARVEGTACETPSDDDLTVAWQEGWDTQDEILRLRKEIPPDSDLSAAVRKFATATASGSFFDSTVEFLGHSINLWQWRILMHRYGPSDATRLVISSVMKAVRQRSEREEYEARYRADRAGAADIPIAPDDAGEDRPLETVEEPQEPACEAEQEAPSEVAEQDQAAKATPKKAARVPAAPRAKPKARR